MNGVVWRKCFQESKWLLVGCGVALVALGWVFVWTVSQFNTSQFRDILNLLPDRIKQMSDLDVDWVITETGRVSMYFEDPSVLFILVVFCIARSSDCVSGELGRGTMELLLAQPVSRLQVVLAHWTVTLAGVCFLAFAAWGGVSLGILTCSVSESVTSTWHVPIVGWDIPMPFGPTEEISVPMSERVDSTSMIPGVINFFCLGFFICGLTSMLSSMDRYRWRTIGIVSAILVVSSLLKILSMTSPSLNWLSWFSFLTAYEPEIFIAQAFESPSQAWSLSTTMGPDQTSQLGPLGSDLILLTGGLICYTIGAITFCKRDLPAPV